MARLVYACRFEVPGSDGISDVVSAYRDWLTEHYRDRRNIPEFSFDPITSNHAEYLPSDHALSSFSYQQGMDRVSRLAWSFPADNDPGLRWSNDIRLGQFGDRCVVEHLISIESVEYSIAPARLIFGSPRVVRDICSESPAFVGEMQIKAVPYDLRQGGLGDFLTLLSSDMRKLPIVLLSPYAHGEPNLLDADQLAKNLAGVAVVVRIEDPEVTWDFADEVGRQLSCFNGAARIYWPGFSNEADPRGHRLFFGAWIEQVSPGVAARAIERAIFAVAAFRFVPDRRIVELVKNVEAAERQKQLSEKKATGDDFWGDYERDLARLDEAEQRVVELEAENANLRANQKVLFSEPLTPEADGELGQDETTISFSTVSEAVAAAAEKCHRIEILESAKAAAADSPFQRPFDVYKALTDLNEIVDVWRENMQKNGSGGDLLQHLRDRGWGKRSSMHISDTTRGKFRSHYEFDYREVKQLFEPHITIGAGAPNSCASIHFILDHDRKKIIVGHVGKHLPNTKT